MGSEQKEIMNEVYDAPVKEEKKKKKKFLLILFPFFIIFLVLVIGVAGFVGYKFSLIEFDDTEKTTIDINQEFVDDETIDFDALGQWSFERGFCGRDIKTAVVNTCKEALYCQVDEVTHEMFLTECKKILDERLNARSANTSKNTLHDVDDDTHAGKSLAEFMEAEAENLKNKFFDDVPYADDLDFAKIVALYSEFQPGEAHRAAHLAKVFAAVDPEQAVVKWEHIEKAAKKIKAAETTSPDLQETLEATVSEIMKNE